MSHIFANLLFSILKGVWCLKIIWRADLRTLYVMQKSIIKIFYENVSENWLCSPYFTLSWTMQGWVCFPRFPPSWPYYLHLLCTNIIQYVYYIISISIHEWSKAEIIISLLLFCLLPSRCVYKYVCHVYLYQKKI